MDHGFDADFYAASGFGGVEIAELKEEGARGFDNFLRGSVCGLVHTAFVAGKPYNTSNPRAASRELGAPHDFIGVAAV
jgi:hypothetical protein